MENKSDKEKTESQMAQLLNSFKDEQDKLNHVKIGRASCRERV